MLQPLVSARYSLQYQKHKHCVHFNCMSERFECQQSSLQRRRHSPRCSTNRGLSHFQCGMRAGEMQHGTQSLRELPAVSDGDGLGGLPRPGAVRLHFLHHVHSCRHAAKHNMPAIQPERTESRIIFYPWTSRTIPARTLMAFPWQMI